LIDNNKIDSTLPYSHEVTYEHPQSFSYAGSVRGGSGSTRTADVWTDSFTTDSHAAVNSVHKSTARIFLKHLKKMQANPKHNPFATGEVATAFRMHCDALQASGMNPK
jgi:hypothetical protein